MGIQYSETRAHWNYYLALEDDFLLLSRYIEFCDENNKTFSLELARIIMTSAQEVDVILKVLFKSIDSEYSGGIGAYFNGLTTHMPSIFQECVVADRFSMTSKPFSTWTEQTSPLWWTANNKIKHHRSTEFKRATLKNAFNALSALLVAVVYFYRYQIGKENNREISWIETTDFLLPRAKVLSLKDEYYSLPMRMGERQW